MTNNRTVLAAVAAMLLLVACGSSEEPRTLTGAGATFPYPIYSKWFSEYQKAHPLVQINYVAQGSGAGISQVTEGTVDFGASDQPMNDEQIQKFKTARSSDILLFPTVLGAVIPTYNLPGVTEPLNFTSAALAGIFLGKITKWNDPAIASANPGVKLPAEPITVVYRSEASGTSFVWTDFLTKVSPEWASGPGKGSAISWPAGIGGKGSEGVTGLVKQTPNSIGYTEMIYAIQNKIPMGNVQNAAGKFIKASPESVTAAAASVEMPADFRLSITNASGDGAYPISSYTWLLVPATIQDKGKREVIVDFLKWMLTTGQTMAPALQYAQLPSAVVAKEQAAIGSIK
jgi:phosphate transport system substrate-binding protein